MRTIKIAISFGDWSCDICPADTGTIQISTCDSELVAATSLIN